jgi:endonuclease/exonuclease/phosphatase family metal-dependent hydrolase
VFKVPGVKKYLLVITCHLSAYPAGAALREVEVGELFAAVGAPLYDYCVITGDFNTKTDGDRELLRQRCAENDYGMAIGDYLPWIPTCYGRDGREQYSYDNILVSGKCTIRRVMVMADWYGRLYSDHVPLIADVALG